MTPNLKRFVHGVELSANVRRDVLILTQALRKATEALEAIQKESVRGDETTTEINCFYLCDEALTEIEALASGELK